MDSADLRKWSNYLLNYLAQRLRNLSCGSRCWYLTSSFARNAIITWARAKFTPLTRRLFEISSYVVVRYFTSQRSQWNVHSANTGPKINACTWFGDVYCCCCLPLLPQHGNHVQVLFLGPVLHPQGWARKWSVGWLLAKQVYFLGHFFCIETFELSYICTLPALVLKTLYSFESRDRMD